MKTISLTQGKDALVDDEDFDAIARFKWFVLKDSCNTYAARRNPENHSQLILMHRALMDTPLGKQTDHINGNGLDNRKENLRICTGTENQRNSRLRRDNKSGFKGVGWHKHIGRWSARIRHNGKSISLGYFADPKDAAKRYNEEATRLWGSFAKVNEL